MPLRYLGLRLEVLRAFRHAIGKTAVIFPAAFLVALGLSVSSLGLNFHLRDGYHATRVQVGGFFALWSLCYIGGCLFVRPLTDSIQPRYLVAWATSMMFAFTLGLSFCPWLGLAFVLYGLFGLATSLFWPPLMGWLSADAEGEDLSRAMSRFNLSWSLGAIVGLPLAGRLSHYRGEVPIMTAAGLFLLTASLVTGAVLALPRAREDVRVDGDEEDRPGVDRSTPLRFPAWVGLFTTFVALGVVINIFPLSAREDLGLSKSAVGWLLFARALFASMGFVVMGRTTFWHHKSWVMLSGQAATGALMIGMVFARHPALLGAVLAMLGLTAASAYFNSLFHGATGSVRRTARMAIHESLLSGGSIAGSFVGGLIYQRRPMAWVYGFCAATVLAGALVQSALCWRAGRADQAPR